MNRFGKFLEFSIPVEDVQASLAFYRDLGFTELPTGDIRDYHYAVVTDGRIAIGLHGSGLDQVALSFVQADVAARIRELEAAGIEMLIRRLGSEQFNEAGFHDPERHLVLLLEAPTFSPSVDDGTAVPATGRALSVRLASAAPERTAQFWIDYGFVPDDSGDAGLARLLAPGLVLELDSALGRNRSQIRFRADDPEALMELLERKGIGASRTDEGLTLVAPEGTTLIVSPG